MHKQIKFIIILPFSLHSLPTFACSCIGENKVKEEVKRSDAVLIGTVIGMQAVSIKNNQEKNDSVFYIDRRVMKYDLAVEKIYKGHITRDTVSIYTGTGGGDCGYRFEMWETYIIYTQYDSYFDGFQDEMEFPKGDNIYWTNICSRTRVFDQKESNDIEKYVMRRGSIQNSR